MTTYLTGNLLGSADPRDLYDNAQVIDDYANSEADTTTDRMGVSRRTLAGMEGEFDADQSDRASEYAADKTSRDNTFDADQADRVQRFNALLAASGYVFLADYAAGIEVTEYNEVVRDTSGEFWRASGSTALPYTTTGAGMPEGGAFVSVGDAALRQELAAGVSTGQGALNVSGSVIYVDTIADLQALPVGELVDGQAAKTLDGDFYWDAGTSSWVAVPIVDSLLRGSLTSDEGASLIKTTSGQSAQHMLSNADAYTSSPMKLYESMSDPYLPMPSFIECWALNSFAGVKFDAPPNSEIPKGDTNNDLILEYIVSGSAGASTLTIAAGDQSLGNGSWAGVIQHDDLSYGIYYVTNVGDGDCSIFPPLRSTVTDKTLRNVGSAVGGQHLTRPAYKALARHIFNAKINESYRGTVVDKFEPRHDSRVGWLRYPELTVGQFSGIVDNNAFLTIGAFSGRSKLCYREDVNGISTTILNRGTQRTFNAKGRKGILEAFVCSALTGSRTLYPIKVEIEADGNLVYEQNYQSTDGLIRVTAEYPAANDVVFRAYYTADVSTAVFMRIDSVCLWATDAVIGSGPVIDPDAKTVLIGDSWGTWADYTLGNELQQAITDAGGAGTLVNESLGGMTAEWALSEFENRIAVHNPEQVVILFFTNDANQYGLNMPGIGRWLTALYKLGRRCQQIGARPVFVMPVPTASLAQSARHGDYAAELGRGIYRA